ncbi:MAG: hypothetical protein CMH34_13110 [Microbacterium sp.]|nr:hypothetical protein [Microbacterium sp.]|tara:strand:+ start:1625 stop:1870 length:246 start_codon:yes stop_codon:yes gene_type:complete
MAVQLHYYGSVFDLDPNQTDLYWVEFIDSELKRAHEAPRGLITRIDLADGRGAYLPVRGDTPLAVVAPRDLLDAQLDGLSL